MDDSANVQFRFKVSKAITMEGEEFSGTIGIFNCSLILEIFANDLAELKIDILNLIH